MNIYKYKEDGTLNLGYAGMNSDNYDPVSVDEFIDIVENTETWDGIDPEVYKEALDTYGLDFDDYDDPDTMWDDFLKAAKRA